jgi:hypothetical protein
MAGGRKSMSVDTMRVGKSYHIQNLGEHTSFTVLASMGENDFRIKDLLTLEVYEFQELIKYGLGDDYELYEIKYNFLP